MKSERLELKPNSLHETRGGSGWGVRAYKNRRGGEVVFQVYDSYKSHLEEYRQFLQLYFPNTDLLFPLYQKTGFLSESRHLLGQQEMLRRLCRLHDVPWINGSSLRNTRVNWLLRRSGDEDLTSDMAQHTKEVLRDRYERPSQQRAMVEITRFWDKHDPIKKGDLKASIISGKCDGIPEAVDDKPSAIVEPNCVNPAGCLWCQHRRDLSTLDYVWSVTSLRHLKSIEAAGVVGRDKSPADLAIDRLSMMLDAYKTTSEEASRWVEEASERVEEGHYHPNWAPIIEFLE